MSLPLRGAWIEIIKDSSRKELASSLPLRGAWIEISCRCRRNLFCSVAPPAGSVD